MANKKSKKWDEDVQIECEMQFYFFRISVFEVKN
jgi:hypothetical protein